jgi:hypothetical protein
LSSRFAHCGWSGSWADSPWPGKGLDPKDVRLRASTVRGLPLCATTCNCNNSCIMRPRGRSNIGCPTNRCPSLGPDGAVNVRHGRARSGASGGELELPPKNRVYHVANTPLRHTHSNGSERNNCLRVLQVARPSRSCSVSVNGCRREGSESTMASSVVVRWRSPGSLATPEDGYERRAARQPGSPVLVNPVPALPPEPLSVNIGCVGSRPRSTRPEPPSRVIRPIGQPSWIRTAKRSLRTAEESGRLIVVLQGVVCKDGSKNLGLAWASFANRNSATLLTAC